MNEPQSPCDERDVDWSLTTWEGARREQMRRWAALPLERAIMALEEMESLSQNLQDAPSGVSVARESVAIYSRDTTCNNLELTGCTPEPLMAYLKALGVLRLVGEQKDSEARGWWKNDVFWLRTSLDRDALVKFFLEEYRPTPILSPWNGDGGFLSETGTSIEAISHFRESADGRLVSIKKAIQAVDGIPLMREFHEQRDRAKELEKKKKAKTINIGESEELRVVNARVKEIKQTVVASIRNGFPEESLQWLDSCVTLNLEGFSASPLLGSGGLDGKLDFGTNFLVNIRFVFADLVKHKPKIYHSLFGDSVDLEKSSIGQFSPGQIGAPNSTQGFEGVSLINPWDYILMLEGALLLTGAAVRRFDISESGRATFPFTVRPVAAGYSSRAPKDAAESRGELWLPLWNRPSKSAELRLLFGEARAEVPGRPARTGTDFARAVTGLGVDRGITGFSRFAFLKRSGKMFLGAPLGKFEVAERFGVDLLREIDPWLNVFRRASGDKFAPPRFGVALRRIDSVVFEFCKHGGTMLFQEIVVALGASERVLANSERFRQKKRIRPLADLSEDWITAADDGSMEFAVALALASIHDTEGRIGPFRANLEPVDWGKRCRAWAEKDRAVVWNATDLTTNMLGVLQRRMMDSARAGCTNLPLTSRISVPLETVSAFLGGELDDERIENLVWGLMLIKGGGVRTKSRSEMKSGSVPRPYALLKLLFLPRSLVVVRGADGEPSVRFQRDFEQGGISIRPESSIFQLLRGGRLGEACAIAMRRLRASGLSPMPGPIRGRRVRDDDWRELDGMTAASIDPIRLAAALLIPISDVAVSKLARLIIRGDEVEQDRVESVVGTKPLGGTLT